MKNKNISSQSLRLIDYDREGDKVKCIIEMNEHIDVVMIDVERLFYRVLRRYPDAVYTWTEDIHLPQYFGHQQMEHYTNIDMENIMDFVLDSDIEKEINLMIQNRAA